MIPEDPTFWRLVRTYADQMGEDAAQEALSGAVSAHQAGNSHDAAGWMTVYRAIKLLDAGFVPDRERRH